MDILSEKKFLEYESKLEYNSSKLDFLIRLEKINCIIMTLIYNREIEYYLEFNFIDFQIKNPEFKSIYDFFNRLNEYRDKYHFYINRNNKEYTDISLYFFKDKYYDINFRLINKNKNKDTQIDIDSYKEKKLLSLSADEIIGMCGTGYSGIILNDIKYKHSNKTYSFKFHDNSLLIFLTKIKLQIYNYKENEIIIEENVRTNYEIKKIIIENKIREEEIFCSDYSVSEVINYINIYIEEDTIKLRIIKRDIPKAIFGEKILNINQNYTRSQYSKYFSEYFENYNPKNNNKIFKYLDNEKRTEIFNNIIKLRKTNEIKQYNITGPCSSGKSMTLFIFSKIHKNVIYINLKVLNKYKNNYSKCLKIIFSECNKLQIDEKIFNKKMEELKIQANVIYQLLYIIKIIIELTKENIILILDQYKEYKQDILESYNYRMLLFDIKKLINKKNNLKLVLCRQIDTHENRYEMIQTWTKYKGNPSELNLETQEFCFYYNQLFIRKKMNTFLYKYFHNNYKYIKKAFICKNLDSLYNKIIKQMKKFEYFINLDNKEVNLCDILIFLKNMKNNIEFDKVEEADILYLLKLIPLQFFSLELNKYYLIIEPIFPFINYCITKYINIKECDKYYNNVYSSFCYFSKFTKENYFDYSTIDALKNNKSIEMPFDYNNKKENIFVNDITKLDEIKPSFDDLDLEFSKIVNINIDKEEYYYLDDEEDENKKEKKLNGEVEDIVEENNNYECKESIFNVEENIIIDLSKINNEEILSKKIEEIISYYYLKDFAYEYQKEIESINEKEEDYEGISEETIEYSKGINNFKKEIYEKIIIKRKEELLKVIKEKYNQNNKKGKIKIPISKYNTENISNFNGDEIFMIEQGNKKGDLFDFAILYGKRNEKIFLGFQMIYYPVNENLYGKLLKRYLYRRILSPILINSIKLLNCRIKEWHYFPIVYYRENNYDILNVGYNALLFSLGRDYEYLLYDPFKKKFLSKDLKPLKNIELTDLSTLDNSSNLSNIFNYTRFPLNFFDEDNYNKYKIYNHSGIYKFFGDFKQYSNKPEDIIEILSKKLSVNKLVYSFYFHFDYIDFPFLNLIYLYKKKESSYFIAIMYEKDFKIIDLETDKNLDIKDLKNNIDLDYEYTYILNYVNKK